MGKHADQLDSYQRAPSSGPSAGYNKGKKSNPGAFEAPRKPTSGPPKRMKPVNDPGVCGKTPSRKRLRPD